MDLNKVIFKRESKVYALDFSHIETIQPSSTLITDVEKPEFVDGYFAYKGRIYAVLNIDSIHGVPKQNIADKKFYKNGQIIVLTEKEHHLGIFVADVINKLVNFENVEIQKINDFISKALPKN